VRGGYRIRLRFLIPAIFGLVWAGIAAGGTESVEALYARGGAALAKGNLPAAEEAFRKVLAVVPNDVGAHANLGVVYMRERRWDRSRAELETARKLAPQVTGIRLNLGLVWYRQGFYRRAIPEFESVVKDDPGSLQARELLGLSYLFAGRYADSASMLDSMWSAGNGDVNYLYALTVAAGEAGQNQLAEKATARLLEVGNDSAELHLFAGKAYLARLLPDEAIVELNKAAALNPRLAFVHYNLGEAYKQRRDLDKARAEFEADLAIEPDVAYNYDELGTVIAAQGDVATAERYFRAAVKRDPTLASSWYGLGKIYRQRKDYAKALDAFNHAAALDARSTSVLYQRAQVLMALGRRTDAQQDLAKMRQIQQSEDDRLEQQISGKYRDPQLGTGK
jgi:tetratricopeptide (TPR) repeat protein